MGELPPVVCACCLIDEQPELGRGMDVALEHGCAIRDPLTGMWAASEDFAHEDVLAARQELGRNDDLQQR